MNKVVCFIDDDAMERRSWTDSLRDIFANTSIVIEGVEPLPSLADYPAFIIEKGVAALLLDQRMTTAGGATYTGVELAAHLRGTGQNVPIVIVTNYPDDDFSAQGWAVESIVQKKHVLSDPTSVASLEFKSRLSRQIEIVGAVLDEREQRFHDLLVKSMKEPLTREEERELGILEIERAVPLQAAELQDAKALEAAVAELKSQLFREA